MDGLTREKPEGRPGGPEHSKQLGKLPPRLFYPPLLLLAFLMALPWVKPAQGPSDGAKGAIAGRMGGGAEPPPHQVSPIMGSLKAQRPKGPKRLLNALGAL